MSIESLYCYGSRAGLWRVLRLYAEGAAGSPTMLSIGLHCRLVGRPARIALERFLDHVQAHDNLWIARRIDIARHWIAHFLSG
jgi:allantoinase